MKWAQNTLEVAEFSAVMQKILERMFQEVRLTLKNGQTVEGHVYPKSLGNNGGEGGTWQYYGVVTVRTDSGDVDLDCLDIAEVVGPRWSELAHS